MGMDPPGFEPGASRMPSGRSAGLSYGPEPKFDPQEKKGRDTN